MPEHKATPPELEGSFEPPRLIDSLGDERPWTQWDDEFDHSAGISALWVISDNTMVVSNRGTTHHNDQLHNLSEHVYDPESSDFDLVMAWSQGFRPTYNDDADHDTASDLELPRSAGGFTQAYQRLGLSGDVTALTHGLDVMPRVLWPVAWTARVLGVPEQSTVRFKHAPQRLAQAGPRGYRATYDGSRRQMAAGIDRTFVLTDAYQELRFADMLPEERVDRDLNVG